ncbi:MAG: tyrosine recombinase XerC [Propionibacterium sp.]|nr:tyrosine recombinase XerC [Propionibacterium sp.]
MDDAGRMPTGWVRDAGLFADYLRLQRRRSANTERAYLTDLRELALFLQGRGVHDPDHVRLTDLRRWLASQQASEAPATVARRAGTARVFFGWARETGRLGTDPAAGLRSPKLGRRLPQTLTQTEVRELMDAAAAAAAEAGGVRGLRDVAILETLYGSGLRVSELCGLDVGDLDEARGLVRVIGKGDKERIVPLGLPGLRAIDAWRAVRDQWVAPASANALFLGTRGGRINQRVVRRVVHESMRAVPEAPDIGPHGLRHAMATHLLEGGADLRSVQEMVVFYSMWTTEIYTHVSDERVRAAYEQAFPRA